jgi:Cof subfamily protein (haloacid dehalogenase superfamily)
MPGVRMLACDIDGTLLRTDGTISQRTVRALIAAAEVGVVVTLATGRPPQAAAPVVADLGDAVRFVIASNGAVITAARSGAIAEVLHRSSFDRAVADTVVAGLRATIPGIRVSLVTEAGLAFEHGFLDRLPDRAPPVAECDDALVIPGRQVHALYVFHAERHVLDLLPELWPVIPEHLEAIHAGVDAAEVTVAGTDKATALTWLVDHLGCGAADVVAFGDNVNDHGMLRWAGWGVAVANADPATRDVADEVTATNDDDGVAVVVERLLDRR